MSNVFKRFLGLIPQDATSIATVIAQYSQTAKVELFGGAMITVIGTGYTAGDKVFIRGGEIIGQAPAMTSHSVDV